MSKEELKFEVVEPWDFPDGSLYDHEGNWIGEMQTVKMTRKEFERIYGRGLRDRGK